MTAQQRVPDLPEVIGGRYRVLEDLGQGGMGRVVKVEHRHTGELLAMKLVLSHRLNDPLMVQRFRREARAMARVRSEYVVRVTDADTCEELNGAPYLVMELLEGEDLDQYVRRKGRLDAGEVVGILEMVARGLTAVHKANLVHRDLKPQNIFLHRQDDRVVAKLLDFGLARCVEGEDGLAITQTGAVVGTSHYLSPEQVLGQTDLISRATDIWAIGIIAFRLLAGRHYWNFSALPRGVLDIGAVELTPPSSLDGSLSLAFDAWFFRSCDRDPARRWPDAQAQWKGLAVALRVQDTSSPPLPGATREEPEPETRHEPDQPDGKTTAWTPDPKSSGSRDRRQVAVLYYRLVPADRRTREMDPEDFESLNRRLRSELGDVMGDVRQTRHDSELGGQYVFFGYPVAYGDDARRAVEAGLRILEATRALDARLQADGQGRIGIRVGIHTGVVLAGTSEGSTEVVGPALAVATELEHQAALGQLVVGASTWRLLAGRFRGTPIHPEDEESPVVVLGSAEPSEASAEPAPPMVGRQGELQMVLSCLEQAQAGQSQTVLVTGEVGIGKSRFVQAFREAGGVPESAWLECCCSPYFRRTPFHPLTGVVHALVRDASGRGPTGAVSAAEVAAALQALHLDPSLAPFVESLLSLPPSDPSALEQLSPQLRRQRTIQAMIALLHARALAGQLVLVVEDLHWADPSSLELLDRLSVLENAPLLTLLTARPEFRPAWSSPASITPVQLRRLSLPQTSELIARLAGGGIDPEAAEALSRKTDGVPLFIEQLTRLLLDAAGQAGPDAGTTSYPQVNLLQLAAAPTTLRESLTARLDLLGQARELAQLASALGEEIDVEELRALWPDGPAGFDAHLAELVRAKVLQPRGLPPHTRYAFQHALLREAAYDLLPRQARRDVHGRIARTLLGRPEERAAPLELLAHHLAEAGRTTEAAGFLLRAGQAALERSANEEARGHFLRGIDLLRQSAELTEEEATLEVTLRTLTGMTWVVSRGYGVAEVEEAFAGAMVSVRSHRLEDSPAVLPALWAQWVFALVRGRFEEALGQSERLLELAGHSGDPGAAMLGRLARGTALHGLGRFAEALQDLDAGVARYDPGAHGGYRFIYGQDPLMFGKVFQAWGLWCTGHPDRAAALVDEAVAHARGLRHPNSLGFALAISAIIRQYRGEAKPLADSARTLLELSTEQGWLHWMGHARLWAGAAQVMEGNVQEGIAAMREARALAEQGGEKSGGPHYDAVLIDGLLRGGLLEEARQRLTRAREHLHSTGEFAFEAELLCLEGELAKRQGDYGRARDQFAQAADSAATRGSRSYELRAVTGLVRLERLAGGDDGEALARLTRLLGDFTEGFDTADLRAARQELQA